MPFRLLFADDSPTMQQIMRITMAQQDAMLDCAQTGQEALDAAKKNPPDIVVVDVGMPVLDGYMVCEALRGDVALAHTPIFLLGSRQNVVDEARAQKIGVTGILSKPFETRVFLDALKHAVAQAQKKHPAPSIALSQDAASHTRAAAPSILPADAAAMTITPLAPPLGGSEPAPNPTAEAHSRRDVAQAHDSFFAQEPDTHGQPPVMPQAHMRHTVIRTGLAQHKGPVLHPGLPPRPAVAEADASPASHQPLRTVRQTAIGQPLPAALADSRRPSEQATQNHGFASPEKTPPASPPMAAPTPEATLYPEPEVAQPLPAWTPQNEALSRVRPSSQANLLPPTPRSAPDVASLSPAESSSEQTYGQIDLSDAPTVARRADNGASTPLCPKPVEARSNLTEAIDGRLRALAPKDGQTPHNYDQVARDVIEQVIWEIAPGLIEAALVDYLAHHPPTSMNSTV